MASINEVYGGNSLKAADLEGDTQVTITTVVHKTFDDGAKLVLSLKEMKKQFVCNKTNATRIAQMHGDDYTTWKGKKITLFVDSVDFKGEQVDAVRVKVERRKAGPAAPESSAVPNTGQYTGGVLNVREVTSKTGVVYQEITLGDNSKVYASNKEKGSIAEKAKDFGEEVDVTWTMQGKTRLLQTIQITSSVNQGEAPEEGAQEQPDELE